MTRKKHNYKTPFAFSVAKAVFPVAERISTALALRLFLFFFTRPFRFPVPSKEKEWEDRAEKFTFVCEGRKIQGYSWGRGPAVLVLHGWAGRATQFYKFIDAFTRAGYRVVGMDGPAHGNSEGRHTDILDFFGALLLLKKEVGEITACIGHSFGGVVALYANANGFGVNTQINIASPTIGDDVIKGALERVNGSPETGEKFKEWIRIKRGKSFDEVSAVYLASRVPEEFRLMVIHDENDRELSMDHPRALAKARPSVQMLITKGLGHNRILKDEKVVAAALSFVQERGKTA